MRRIFRFDRTITRVDVALAMVLFAAAAVGSVSYWKRMTVNGQVFYYQHYFEPAVMVACHKGYVVARPQVPEMVPFLWRQTDRFDCAAIPPDAPLGTDDMYQQGSWRYLMTTVGYTWRLFGVSWSALGPLFGLFFAISVASLYAIFRTGMGRLLATVTTVAVALSTLHLKYFFSLRDYSKAPFTLALIALLGTMVLRAPRTNTTLAIAAAYGAIAGIGYGFRSDLTTCIPIFVITLALFLPGGVSRNLALKAIATVLCALVFVTVSWPVISTLGRAKTGCQWHVVVLGFARQFNPVLGIEPAPYDVGREYLDEWAYTTVTSYAARVHPGIGHREFCEAPHGEAAREYLTEVARRFPADLVVRVYASIRRVAELPFSPVPGLDDDEGPPDWGAGHGIGLAIVVTAIFLAMGSSVRLGLFLIVFLMYFGALPALQYDHRHLFHLAFITWWAAGFLLQAALTEAPAVLVQWSDQVRPMIRAAALLAGVGAILIAVLWSARVYQQPRVRDFLTQYVSAARDPIPLKQIRSMDQGIRAAPRTDPETADYVIVDVNASLCGPNAAVVFEYDDPRRPYGRVFDVGGAESNGLTQIFMPIFDGFRRLEFKHAPEGCVDGVYRMRDAQRFGLLLEAVLTPGWRRRPLYQRLAD